MNARIKRAADWYLPRVLSGEIPQPVLNSSDQLVVAGFVKTTPFELFIGDGQDGAGLLDYSLSPTAKSFHLEIETSNLAIGTKLKVDTSDMATKRVKVLVNGDLVETITGGGVYQTEQLGHEATLLLQVAVAGDYDHSGVVDSADYSVWKQTMGSNTLLSADGNNDGVVDLSDYPISRYFPCDGLREAGRAPCPASRLADQRLGRSQRPQHRRRRSVACRFRGARDFSKPTKKRARALCPRPLR